MPRLARLDAPGALHHVMIRGIERRNIFKDNKDRDNLIGRLALLLPEAQMSCYAWALMPNHAHFLFSTGTVGLSTLMRKLLTGYAVTFNRRHKRHGQLFDNRYKSIICQEDIYLKELVRYIHLNPLRAKRVRDMSELSRYSYSGHSALMGKKERPWQDTDYVLSCFARRAGEARRRYSAYVREGIEQGRRPELVGGGLIRSLGGWAEVKRMRLTGHGRLKGDERILGDSDFVMEVLSQADEKYTRQHELKNLGYDLKKIADRAGQIYQMDPSYILSRGRQSRRVDARSFLCYWAVRELGMALTQLARELAMSPSAVSYAVERGKLIAKDNNYQLADY